MNIMDLFRPAPAAQNPAPATAAPTGAANPGQPLPGTQATPGTSPNGVVPAQDPNANPGNPGTSNVDPASPLANFAGVWDTPTNQADPATQGVFAGVDPKKFFETAQKVNFTGAIPAEKLQAISQGGEAAVKAFGEVMNQVAQSVYAQSALASTKLIDQALLKAQESYDSRIPTMVKKFSVNENLRAENPLLANPAIAPLASALTEQLTRKNPNATAAEIQSQVNDYFASLGQAFNPPKVDTNASSKGETDWEKFLTS